MSFDLGSLGLYLAIYTAGGLLGLGVGAVICAAGRSRLIAENDSLRQRVATMMARDHGHTTTPHGALHHLDIHRRIQPGR